MDWGRFQASLVLWLAILSGTIQDGNAEQRIVCYYASWSVYRPGTAKFLPQNINPYLCTHLVYAFGGFTKDNALKPFDKYQDIEKGGYAKFTGLKTYNKNLKTLLAIGGWNEGSSRFSPMVADSARRREFVKNSVKFLRQNHFDGLDLDWEYPAFRDGGKPRDRENYANLVQELREEFERESSKTGRPRLLLTMAMPAGAQYIDKGYDVPRLNEYLDFINLLSYDYHGSFEPAVNHHAPLYPLEEDNEYNYDAELTIDYTINHLLKKGASADKIVLGIPTYGRSFTLFNADATDLGSPADGAGIEGEATREKGSLSYFEICESIAESDDWEVVHPNPNAMGPYAFKDDQWVGYDDEDIVKLKARYVSERGLGGIMFWSIDSDDFRGKCHDRPYPLIEAAKEALLTGTTRSSVQKTKPSDTRKKSRPSGVQTNAIVRKTNSGGRRRTTTAASTRKRASRPKYRTFTRSKSTEEEDEEEKELERRSYEPSSEEDDTEVGNAVRVVEKQQSTRPKIKRTRGKSGTPRSRRKQSRRTGEGRGKDAAADETPLSNRLTTPEPPTTPDPGADFKCEDEGFFPHPRDCKKYFWCLDSGPGGLGVVAHQFTCPSGLVFNKAADSCDYPRNVVCPKSKTSPTVSTTRAPITAATSRTTYLHTSTRRTTTEKAESEEEYEYYDEEEIEDEEEEQEEPKVTTTAKPLLYKTINRSKPTTATTTTTTTTVKPIKNEPEKSLVLEDEEDPRVIKELIDLIKKAGGIEQLEKQLLLQEKGTGGGSEAENVTPATISRSLYERVLNRQANRATSSQRKADGTNQANGPGGTQFEGLDEIPEVKSLRRSHKPQYVTIERPRASTKEPPVDDEDEEEDEDDFDAADGASEEQTISNPFFTSSTHRPGPNYVNIRRPRPSTTTSRNENDVDQKAEEEEEERPVRRRRPSLSNKNNQKTNTGATDRAGPRVSETEETPTTKSRYVNIQRFRSTTAKLPEETLTENASGPPLTERTIEATSVSPTEPAIVVEPIESSTATTTLSTVPSIPSSVSVETTEGIMLADATQNDTANEANSTSEPVRLVEESATEILLTTVPASSSRQTVTSVSTNRATAATVSQPRPFGFPRRTRPQVQGESSSTTPLAPSSEQLRSKVSIASQTPSRASFLPGRNRLRPRQDNRGTEPRAEKLEGSNSSTEDPQTRIGSRSRGTSRYTPPSYASKTESQPANSVSRNRVRVTETSTARAQLEAPVRKRFRRPSATTASPETARSNELEDSQIVRISQANPRRSNFRSRYGLTTTEPEPNDKITNIRVFKRPATVNRDIYTRTRYTSKRNNPETSEASPGTVQPTQQDKPTSPVLFATASTLTLETERIDENSVDIGTEEPLANSVDAVDGITRQTTELPTTWQKTATEAVEANTVEANTVEPFYTTSLTTESVLENEVTLASTTETDGIPRTTTTNAPEGSSEVVKREPESNEDVNSSSSVEKTSVPRRRKILLRRRPVVQASSTTAAPGLQEEEQKRQVVRKRKVIKRIRPVHNETASTPMDADSAEEVNQGETEPQLLTTISMNDQRSTETPETENDVRAQSTRIEDTTESLSTLTTESTMITEGSDGFFSETTRNDYETTTEEGFSDFDISTVPSTDFADRTTESMAEATEFLGETNPTEPRTPVTLYEPMETTESLETAPTAVRSEDPPTTVSRGVTTSTPVQEDERNRNKTNGFDARYVRKKFIRRRPVSAPSAPSSAEIVPGRYAPLSRTIYRVSSTTDGTPDGEVLSKRRKSLFVRRRPVSSTAQPAKTVDDVQENDEEVQLEVEEETDPESVTYRINLLDEESQFTGTPSTRRDSEEFWNSYTTASLFSNQKSLSQLDDFEDAFSERNPINLNAEITEPKERATNPRFYSDEENFRTTTVAQHRSEFRPRYRSSNTFRKASSNEEPRATVRTAAYDLAQEESEETAERNEGKFRYQNYRQPRRRYRYRDGSGRGEEEKTYETEVPVDETTQVIRSRFYARRPIPTTDPPVTETLIPARKFDYAADAILRRQQSLRTTPRSQEPGTGPSEEAQNYVETDYTTVPSVKPLVTRLVTSVEESATTERQKILIKTKYSSLTSTTRIPVQTSTSRVEYPSTTVTPLPDTLITGSEGTRLPTLKELIGGKSDNDFTSTPSSVYLNLLPINANDEFSLQGVEEPDGSSVDENRRRVNLAAVLGISEFRERPKESEEEDPVKSGFLFTNDADGNRVEDEASDEDRVSENRKKKTIFENDAVPSTVKPTTMRGIPLARLTTEQVSRGFYLTKDIVPATKPISVGTTESPEETTLKKTEEEVTTSKEANTEATTVADQEFQSVDARVSTGHPGERPAENTDLDVIPTLAISTSTITVDSTLSETTQRTFSRETASGTVAVTAASVQDEVSKGSFGERVDSKGGLVLPSEEGTPAPISRARSRGRGRRIRIRVRTTTPISEPEEEIPVTETISRTRAKIFRGGARYSRKRVTTEAPENQSIRRTEETKANEENVSPEIKEEADSSTVMFAETDKPAMNEPIMNKPEINEPAISELEESTKRSFTEDEAPTITDYTTTSSTESRTDSSDTPAVSIVPSFSHATSPEAVSTEKILLDPEFSETVATSMLTERPTNAATSAETPFVSATEATSATVPVGTLSIDSTTTKSSGLQESSEDESPERDPTFLIASPVTVQGDFTITDTVGTAEVLAPSTLTNLVSNSMIGISTTTQTPSSESDLSSTTETDFTVFASTMKLTGMPEIGNSERMESETVENIDKMDDEETTVGVSNVGADVRTVILKNTEERNEEIQDDPNNQKEDSALAETTPQEARVMRIQTTVAEVQTTAMPKSMSTSTVRSSSVETTPSETQEQTVPMAVHPPPGLRFDTRGKEPGYQFESTTTEKLEELKTTLSRSVESTETPAAQKYNTTEEGIDSATVAPLPESTTVKKTETATSRTKFAITENNGTSATEIHSGKPDSATRRRRLRIRVNQGNWGFGEKLARRRGNEAREDQDKTRVRIKVYRGRQRGRGRANAAGARTEAVGRGNLTGSNEEKETEKVKGARAEDSREFLAEEESENGKRVMIEELRSGTESGGENPTAVGKEERPEDPDRVEVKGPSSPRKPGTLLAARLRKPPPFSSTPSSTSEPSFDAGHPEKEAETKNDKPDGPVAASEEPKDSEVSDQSIRAQELAVTLSDPPSLQSSGSGRPLLRDTLRRRISTTIAPRTDTTTSKTTVQRHRTRNRQKSTTSRPVEAATRRPKRPPIIDYDYYEDEEEPIVGKSTFTGKILLSSKGTVRCTEQGNFPHPYSCKKFITCARMVNGQVVGAEYTCPDKLSFDPVGGICNWSAGLGCKE